MASRKPAFLHQIIFDVLLQSSCNSGVRRIKRVVQIKHEAVKWRGDLSVIHLQNRGRERNERSLERESTVIKLRRNPEMVDNTGGASEDEEGGGYL